MQMKGPNSDRGALRTVWLSRRAVLEPPRWLATLSVSYQQMAKARVDAPTAVDM